MRQDSGRRALQYGLLGSAILHLAIFALNPGVDTPGPGTRARDLAVPADAVRVLELGSSDRAGTPSRAPGAPVPVANVPAPDSAPGAVAAAAPAAAPRTSRELSAIERLTTPRHPLLWRPPQPEPETREQVVLRELAARLAQAAREPAAPKDPWTVLGRIGGVEVVAGNGDVGVRIPFGRKPPPPAQVVPAPARLASLRHDSTRRRGDLVHAWHDGYSIALPATLTQGVTFEVSARFPGPVDRARVRFFIDDVAATDAVTINGVAHASLRIASAGAHRIRVHFLGAAAYAPAELLHAVQVDAAPAEAP